ncbi:MAG: hypothetical protein NTU44_10205 [Bacteroidetes bacterium]|nr:hypothetical protein [Bacteroidota bacterium]
MKKILKKTRIVLLSILIIYGTTGWSFIFHHCNASNTNEFALNLPLFHSSQGCCCKAAAIPKPVGKKSAQLKKAACCEVDQMFFKVPVFSAPGIFSLLKENAVHPDFQLHGLFLSQNRVNSNNDLHKIPFPSSAQPQPPPSLNRYLLLHQIRIPFPDSRV